MRDPLLFSGTVRTGPLLRRLLICLTTCAALVACGAVPKRSPIPADQIEEAAPYGIKANLLRFWGDGVGEKKLEALKTDRIKRLKQFFGDRLQPGARLNEDMIAFSGGGPDGAYGAGLMHGWTARGGRPDFGLVTGISAGAIVALFTFLGPDYDQTLEAIFSDYETDALFSPALFSALTGGAALADNSGYRHLIAKYVTADVVAQIAKEADRGRVLFIGTTNLDAARPVVWDVTQVAASGDPKALELIREIIRASSAIPAALPPAVIPVIGTDGKRYDEVHVDGGAVTQVTLLLPQVPLREFDEALGVTIDRRAFVVVNNELVERYDPVKLRLFSITEKAVGSLIGGSDLGDLYEIYTLAQRDGVEFNVTYIPESFHAKQDQPFDPVYMQALYRFGYETGLKGDFWLTRPPGYKPGPGEAVKEGPDTPNQ